MTGARGPSAGGGQPPVELARAARARGHRVVAVGHVGATDPKLEREVDALTWVRVGQLKKTVAALAAGGAGRALFGGSLSKAAALTQARPDVEALKLWTRLDGRGDDRLLRAVADWFERNGVAIVGPLGLLEGCFAARGEIAGPAPKPADLREAERGLQLCHALGKHDIGQTLAVREGMVLAVEALEGTDACIRRAGALASGAIVVKALKPGQDRRFDLPAIGPKTLETLAKAKAKLLAVEAGVTLVIDRPALARLARKHRVSVVGL